MINRGNGRPEGGAYLDEHGEKVPSVTTIVGRYADKSGLLKWYHDCGVSKHDPEQDYTDPWKSFRGAGHLGTAVHNMFEHYVHGDDPAEVLGALIENTTSDKLEDTTRRAQACFDALRNWYDAQSGLVLTETETPYVHSVHRYGGTLDLVGTANGLATLLDIKTSNYIYPQVGLQLAAYDGLYTDRHGTGFAHHIVLHISKRTCQLKVIELQGVAHQWRYFLRLLDAYNDAEAARREFEKAVPPWRPRRAA